MAYTDIDDPTAYFQVKTYVGNANTNAITNDGNSDLQPDFLWIKVRDATNYHNLFDSLRTTYSLNSNVNAAEADRANDGFTSLNSNGSKYVYLTFA